MESSIKKIVKKQKKVERSWVIPPCSIIELVKANDTTPLWKNRIGKRYRIGFYSPQDGLDTIWLVDDSGDYFGTIDHDYLLKYFKIIRLSKIKDYLGDNCKPLQPIKHGKK